MEAIHEETNHNLSEAFRTIMISLITAGMIWLIYTTVETKSNMQLLDYKIEQVSINVKELKEKVK